MPIDINELRRKVNSTDIVDHIELHANIKPFLSELIDRLEAAEKERDATMRLADSLALALNTSNHERDNLRSSMKFHTSLIGRTEAERDVLRDRLALESQESGALHEAVERACEERDALRAKIEAMETQEPIATIHINNTTGNPSVDFIHGHRYLHHNSSLYALPGAQTQGEGND